MRVVHCRKEEFTHYIGRPGPLGNPYYAGCSNRTLSTTKLRETALTRFETYARRTPVIMEIIKDLPEDAVLGCWCTPLPCHGDVIVKIWKELHNEEDQDSL